MERAVALDPLSHNFLADLGHIYYLNREYSEAEFYSRRALELAPDFTFAHEYLSDIYLQTGDFEKAVDARLQAERINARFSIDSTERAARQQASFEKRRSLALQRGRTEFLTSLLSNSTDPRMTYYDARWHASLGNKEIALLLLERSVQSPAFHTVFVKADPVFDPIRNEARYEHVLRRIGLLDINN